MTKKQTKVRIKVVDTDYEVECLFTPKCVKQAIKHVRKVMLGKAEKLPFNKPKVFTFEAALSDWLYGPQD